MKFVWIDFRSSLLFSTLLFASLALHLCNQWSDLSTKTPGRAVFSYDDTRGRITPLPFLSNPSSLTPAFCICCVISTSFGRSLDKGEGGWGGMDNSNMKSTDSCIFGLSFLLLLHSTNRSARSDSGRTFHFVVVRKGELIVVVGYHGDKVVDTRRSAIGTVRFHLFG